MTDTVGFIGLGAMGGPMALNLVKHGFLLVVHDIDPAKAERLRAAGAAVADSPDAVAAAVGRTICMVETTAQAESVIAGEDGVILEHPAGHALFLPEVAAERGWSREQLFAQLCRKARVPEGAWREAALLAFRSQKFGE